MLYLLEYFSKYANIFSLFGSSSILEIFKDLTNEKNRAEDSFMS